jgi:DNA polymerase-3 subunit delta
MPKDSIEAFNKLVKEIKNKQFKPIYILHGEESFFIDELSDLLEANVLTDAEKAFNLSIVYPKDKEVEPKQVLDMARRFPMMANHHLIIVKEAQTFKKLNDFEPYLDKPVLSTILVICHKGKKIDGRTALGKKTNEHIVRFEAKPLYDEEIAAWITSYMKSNGININAHIATLITEHLGNNLSKVVNELNKLMIVKGKNSEITDEDIEKYIGVNKDFNSFELLSAIAAYDCKRSFYIAKHLCANKDFSIIPFVVQLCNMFAKALVLKQNNAIKDGDMKAYGIFNFKQAADYKNIFKNYSIPKMEYVINLAGEFDLKSKGVNHIGVGHDALMKELLFAVFSNKS